MSEVPNEKHAPPNMRAAYKTLQHLYGEEIIPLILGTEQHGGKTDMTEIEVGKDQMMLCLVNNYHEVPKIYTDSSPFFVLAHEFGHIIAHPGKDAIYWMEGMKELPVEHYQKNRWLNCVSDILVNWTVITATGVVVEKQKATIKKQMTNGWRAGQFVRRCGTQEGFTLHAELLRDSVKGKPLKDNRYQPKGGLPGQYSNHARGKPYTPTPLTPFYQLHMGHGRGEQYYPPINYCVAKNMDEKWRRVKMRKTVGSLKEDRTYVVEGTRSFDNREDRADFEPIKDYKIKGDWVSARYCESLCPQCKSSATTIWDYWWKYTPKAHKDAEIASEGTWRYLLIQMFAFEWAMAYSTCIKYGDEPLNREMGKKFLDDVASDMDAVMRSR